MPKSQPRRALRLVAAGLTDVGRQRRHNEDNVLVVPSFDLYVVADGMGGHSTGHVASALTTTSMHNFFEATSRGDLPSPTPADEADLPRAAERLVQAVRKANRDVFEISSTHKEHRGMGSTVVGIHFDGDELHIAHVGDSRCYRLRGGDIEQLTRDHSLINDALMLKPDLTEEELARLPKNVITRALGMKDMVKVDVQTIPILPDDMFLLCSDGLTGMISNNQILEVFDLTSDLDEACELLIAMANEAGGVDNISALLVRADVVEVRLGLEDDATLEVEGPDVAVEEAVLSSVPLSTDDPALDDTVTEHGHEIPAAPAKSAAVVEHLDASAEVVIASVEDLAEVLSPEDAAKITAGVELEGPRSIDEIKVALCRRCGHELYVGNAFCTDCGLKIEAE